MSDDLTTLRDRLEDILESINLIQEWTVNRKTVDDFMGSSRFGVGIHNYGYLLFSWLTALAATFMGKNSGSHLQPIQS